ncbi:MAG: PilZ domain-containing protein [Deltaproteobacteria bacterium]|nr:PilZ domain-containing protein [Deltaproteobacteria bacterium]
MTQQRKHTRIDFVTDVTVDIDGAKVSGATVNISQGGALLTLNAPVEFGQKLILEILLPKIKETCRIPSVVRWCSDASIGVQFEVLRAIEVWAINQIIHKSK